MKLVINNLLIKLLFALAVIFLLPAIASASLTDGVIDGIYKYAWGENTGWANFGAASGNLHVTDARLTGYAWSANYGWINLNPPTGGVVNNGYGDLSGHAWGENLGWINFSGVSINSSGEFSGYAIIENDNSRISFNCSNTASCSASDFKVKTDWRPRSARPACNNALDDDADGKIDYPDDPGCSDLTDDDEIDLGGSVIIISPAGQPAAANSPAISTPEVKPPVEEAKPPKEELKPEIQPNVTPEPLTEIQKPSENKSPLGPAYQGEPKTKSPLELVLSKLKEMFTPVLSKLARLKPIAPPEITLEKLVPKQAPLALRGQWQVMPTEPIKKFVLAPLPVELMKLAKKFPSLDRMFEEVNISKIADVSRLNNVVLTLPGLTRAAVLPKAEMNAGKNLEPAGLNGLPAANIAVGAGLEAPSGSAGLSGAEISTGKFAILSGLPLAELTAAVKQTLPTEVVFAKAGGELIDYNIDLTINEQGRPQQKITALANQELKLVVKPESQVNSVKGYLVFKSAMPPITKRSRGDLISLLVRPALAKAPDDEVIPNTETFLGRLQDYLSSLIFAKPSLAIKQEIPVPVEEKLVLEEFNYEDSDGDGLWTAEIKTPAASGVYEVITVLYYKDPELGAKAIKLTTVIDPEGYVYEKFQDKELRVPGAIVYLYWFNPEAKQYQVWPAEDYNQTNPQITDISGKYSFLVSPGSYYLKIEAPGYPLYEGKPFQVNSGGGVHTNIELKAKYAWLKAYDWKTILLILVAVFLAYNFYKDKLRTKRS